VTAGAKRILAVDFGDRRTGLAATDYTGAISVPLGTLEGLAPQDCAREIGQVARERDCQVIVLGIPLSVDGSAGKRARVTLGFKTLLESAAPCPVVTTDEAMSTDEAHERLQGMTAARRKRVADSVAALVILERYRQESRG
jgi:putative Holliday junction resolvase